MEPQEKVEWKTTHDLPIDDWKKLAKLFIIENVYFERNKNNFGNRKLYRIIAFSRIKKDFTPHFLIKANVQGDFYHIGSYNTCGGISIDKKYWPLKTFSNCKDVYLIKEENIETKENMNTKEITINVPDGYEIDKENSTFEYIKFKPIVKRWRDNIKANIKGYYIDVNSKIAPHKGTNIKENHNVFVTERQAKSALAMAQISQIMANDKRFGGVVTDEEWDNEDIKKHCIIRDFLEIKIDICHHAYQFLAFHTFEQVNLFFKENKDLIKDYLMID